MLKRLLFLSLLLAGTVAADPPAFPTMSKENPVHIFADQFVYEAPHKLLHLDGHVRFSMKDTEMETQHAEFNTETQIGKLTGGVHITQPGSSVNADHMLIFYAKRRALLSGAVHLVSSQTPGAKPTATPQQPTMLDCDELEYFWEAQTGNAVGHVHVEQGERKAQADVAHYQGQTGLVNLLGHVQFAQGPGDWVQAPEAILNLKEQTFVAQGGVVANITPPEEQHKGGPKGTTPPAPVPRTTRILVPPLTPQLQPVAPPVT
ncbi:MAG TPA: LptA/OstA family protein, partial [Candidatus Xenobia bacterium]